MIHVAIVTGFLGSGKTTLLRHFARRHRARRIVYLLNEFSARDFDATQLSREAADVVAVAGGSIFCQCRVTEFMARLRELPGRFGTPDAPLEGVVVEASGIADPTPAGALLRDTRLDALYALAGVVAIVDPGSFSKLVHTLPSVRAQVAAADSVLLNKIDLYPAALVERAEADIRAIRPDARITRTTHCDAPVDLLAPRQLSATPEGRITPCPDPRLSRFDIPLEHDVDPDLLRAALAELREEIHRVKGCARLGDASFLVDHSTSGLRWEPADFAAPPALSIIARHPPAEQVLRLVDDLRSGRLAPTGG